MIGLTSGNFDFTNGVLLHLRYSLKYLSLLAISLFRAKQESLL